MKILVLGAYGMLGHKLFTRLGKDSDVYGTCRKLKTNESWSWMFPAPRMFPWVKAEEPGTVLTPIRKVKPDVVINCIGIVKQLDAAKDPIQTITVNSLFPHQLAQTCEKEHARLIHFSTDCVFSGKKGKYKATDLTDAEDLYGRTKALGEVNKKGCVTIRSSIIGRELGTRNGLVEWFLSQKGKRVQGYKNAIYSGFTTIEMANIVKMVIARRPELSGTVQIASEPISKCDLLNLIKEKMRLDIKIEPEFEHKIDRSLDGSAFNRLTDYAPPSWESMIEELAKDSTMYESKLESGNR
jgi:dTDP-4-dehydrorhamnose reductase